MALAEDPDEREIMRSMPCTKVRGSVGQEQEDLVPIEEPFEILINGEKAIEVTLSPREIEDFVVGHLICQGLIREPSEIQNLEFGGGWADVHLDARIARPVAKEIIFTACFGSGSGPKGRIEKLKSDFRLHPEAIREAIDTVQQSDSHRLTGGVHICGIFTLPPPSPGITSLCEDIGRHSALDKAVGQAARRGCNLDHCFLATTGRASSEMVAKCYSAGLPLIASRGATTTLAIHLAEAAGITLVGFARGDRLNIYANGWRVIREA